MSGSGIDFLKKCVKDTSFAEHRFHSIAVPWGRIVLIFISFLRYLACESTSPTAEKPKREVAVEALRVLGGKEEQVIRPDHMCDRDLRFK